MGREPTGHIERLPSRSYRVSVYAGTDPLTRRPIRLRATAKAEAQARIELGKLLEKACDGRSPEAGVTVAKLLGPSDGRGERVTDEAGPRLVGDDIADRSITGMTGVVRRSG